MPAPALTRKPVVQGQALLNCPSTSIPGRAVSAGCAAAQMRTCRHLLEALSLLRTKHKR